MPSLAPDRFHTDDGENDIAINAREQMQSAVAGLEASWSALRSLNNGREILDQIRNTPDGYTIALTTRWAEGALEITGKGHTVIYRLGGGFGRHDIYLDDQLTFATDGPHAKDQQKEISFDRINNVDLRGKNPDVVRYQSSGRNLISRIFGNRSDQTPPIKRTYLPDAIPVADYTNAAMDIACALNAASTAINTAIRKAESHETT